LCVGREADVCFELMLLLISWCAPLARSGKISPESRVAGTRHGGGFSKKTSRTPFPRSLWLAASMVLFIN
jgi:hypothetical protein